MFTISRVLLLGGLVAGMTLANPGDPVPKEPPPKYTPEQIERCRLLLRPGEKPLVRPTEFATASLESVLGTVLEVTKTSITFRPDGKKDPVTFPLHDALAAGRLQRCASYPFGYLASDLKVGDIVWLSLCVEDGKKFIADICIEKRPGGRVPESSKPGQEEPTWAMRKNAINDLKDFGIPIPNNCKSPLERMTPAQWAEYDRIFGEFSNQMLERQARLRQQAEGEKK